MLLETGKTEQTENSKKKKTIKQNVHISDKSIGNEWVNSKHSVQLAFKKKFEGLTATLHSPYKQLHKDQSFSIPQPVHLELRPLGFEVSNLN